MRWIENGVEYLENEPLEPWEVALLDRVRALNSDPSISRLPPEA